LSGLKIFIKDIFPIGHVSHLMIVTIQSGASRLLRRRRVFDVIKRPQLLLLQEPKEHT
jgi:hypothetical protein